MKHCNILCAAVLLIGSMTASHAQRSEQMLEKGWRFTKGDITNAQAIDLNDNQWEEVTIPHDWAIYGPFDRNNDLQNVAITQNLETQASVKTGRTGGLPYVGTGWYRTTFNADPNKLTTLIFDGAMSEAHVYVNGKEACFWPFGYNSFHCDVTALLNPDGKNNVLAVRLENRPQSSRWYPGAGLYRNVHVVSTGKIHVPVWGTQITTPHVATDYASVCLKTTIANAGHTELTVVTDILAPDGKTITTKKNKGYINQGQPFTQNFLIVAPGLIVYDRLKDAYCGRMKENGGERDLFTNDLYLNKDLFVPPVYQDEVFSFIQNNVVTKEDGIGRKVTGNGLIALANWHLFLTDEDEENKDSLVKEAKEELDSIEQGNIFDSDN